jgi:hypothetical protein
METKSTFTFRISTEKFIQEAYDHGRRVYFWTFTFNECMTVKEGSKKWNQLLQALKRSFSRIYGIRVFELHTSGHGLHIHALFDSRLDVNEVRPIAKRYGFGRIHVERTKKEDASKIAHYMAKYLGKGFQQRPDCFKHKRLWACVGHFIGYLVKNTVFETGFTRFFKKMTTLRKFNPTDCENQLRELYWSFSLDQLPKSNTRSSRFLWFQWLKQLYPLWLCQHMEEGRKLEDELGQVDLFGYCVKVR